MSIEFSSRKKIFRWADRVIEYAAKGAAKPVHLALHITNRCPHDCPECNGGRKHSPNAELPKDVAIRVARDARELGVKAVSFGGGGDPLAHPDFAEIARAIARMGLSVGVMSNGAILRDADLDVLATEVTWVRISLDAASESGYRQTHGPNARLDVTLDHLVKIAGWPNRKASVGASYLTSEAHVADIPAAIGLAAGAGADYIIFRPYDGDLYDASEVIAKAERPTSIQVVAHYERIAIPTRSYVRCHGMHFIIEVAPDGNVYPCCHWKDRGRLIYGNVLEQSLCDIFHSRTFALVAGAAVDGLCPIPCRNHILNETIEEFFFQPIAHEEFL
jgi:MoaA/NifB/PqqE/SkfB family radical SAM enzyme